MLLRDRFEGTRKEKDLRKLAAMLEEGEEECFQHKTLQPFFFKNDPGGIIWQRQAVPPDSILDSWHPWERVQYMDYFNRREERKLEYEKYYHQSFVKKEVGAPQEEWPVPQQKA